MRITPSDPVYGDVIKVKQKFAASRICFWMENIIQSRTFSTAINGYINNYKYSFSGYAPYEGGYIANFNIPVITHEMGHSFGFAHDIARDNRYLPLMFAPETKTIGTAPFLLWANFRELQIKNFEHKLYNLKPTPPNGGSFGIPEYWKYLFPNNSIVESFTLKDVETTPYYKSGIDLVSTLQQALIDQYNIKLAPSKVTSFEKQIAVGQRQSVTSKAIE